VSTGADSGPSLSLFAAFCRLLFQRVFFKGAQDLLIRNGRYLFERAFFLGTPDLLVVVDFPSFTTRLPREGTLPALRGKSTYSEKAPPSGFFLESWPVVRGLLVLSRTTNPPRFLEVTLPFFLPRPTGSAFARLESPVFDNRLFLLDDPKMGLCGYSPFTAPYFFCIRAKPLSPQYVRQLSLCIASTCPRRLLSLLSAGEHPRLSPSSVPRPASLLGSFFCRFPSRPGPS